MDCNEVIVLKETTYMFHRSSYIFTAFFLNPAVSLLEGKGQFCATSE